MPCCELQVQPADAEFALAMVQIDHSHIGLQAEVHTPFGSRKIEIVEKPFYDPNKNLAVRGKVVGTKNSFS